MFTAWKRDRGKMLGMAEPTPISRLSERWAKRNPEQRRDTTALWVASLAVAVVITIMSFTPLGWAIADWLAQ